MGVGQVTDLRWLKGGCRQDCLPHKMEETDGQRYYDRTLITGIREFVASRRAGLE
jgi:hypothetical protein